MERPENFVSTALFDPVGAGLHFDGRRGHQRNRQLLVLLGATILAWRAGAFNLRILQVVAQETTKISSMVFVILIGASMFSLVFRGFGGDEVVEEFLRDLPGGPNAAMLLVMVIMFLLGFFLDFIEIIFVVVPIVGPILIAMGFDPLWLGVMIGVNLANQFPDPAFWLRFVLPCAALRPTRSEPLTSIAASCPSSAFRSSRWPCSGCSRKSSPGSLV